MKTFKNKLPAFICSTASAIGTFALGMFVAAAIAYELFNVYTVGGMILAIILIALAKVAARKEGLK